MKIDMADWRKVRPAQIIIITEVESYEQLLAQQFCSLLEKLLKVQQQCFVVLSGGNTPILIHREIIACHKNFSIDWGKIHFFLSDERKVPAYHEMSNYKMVLDTLLMPLHIGEENIHTYFDDTTTLPSTAVMAHKLKTIFHNKLPQFDLSIMGIGVDGHTASLFPNTPAVDESEQWVAKTGIGPEGIERLSLTFPVLNASKNIWLLIKGKKKSSIAKILIEGPYLPQQYPVQNLFSHFGKLVYFLDNEAAVDLSPKTISSVQP